MENSGEVLDKSEVIKLGRADALGQVLLAAVATWLYR